MTGVQETYPKVLNRQGSSIALLMQGGQASTEKTAHIFLMTIQNSRQTSRHCSWEDSEMGSSSLKPKVGTEGGCFILKVLPKLGTSCITGWHFCLWQLCHMNWGFCFHGFPHKYCMYWHLKETKCSDTAPLRAGFACCLVRKVLNSIVSKHFFFFPLNFHFCYWNKQTKEKN